MNDFPPTGGNGSGPSHRGCVDGLPQTATEAGRWRPTRAGLLDLVEGPADLKRLAVGELSDLTAEIRRVICDQVASSGGHLASNLGVVELTLALHRVFDFGRDRLLFDVGHQCYPHKLLTGRRRLFDRLRSQDGMSGFPEPRESEYDLFSVGHTGSPVPRGIERQRHVDRRPPGGVGTASGAVAGR
jgi:deoxyxylulose-5-phosphate synthase